MGKCTRRQQRKVELGTKCGEDQGVELLASRSSEFGRKGAGEVVEAREDAGAQDEEGVLSGHCGVEESVKKRLMIFHFSHSKILNGLAV